MPGGLAELAFGIEVLSRNESMLNVVRSPLRISFFGGGTDYPAYFNENPCAVLGASIDK